MNVNLRKHTSPPIVEHSLHWHLLNFNHTKNYRLLPNNIIIYTNDYYQKEVSNTTIEFFDLVIYKLNDDGFMIAKNKGAHIPMNCNYSLNEIENIITLWKI